MPDPIKESPVAAVPEQIVQPQAESSGIVAPDLERELDDALSKQFSGVTQNVTAKSNEEKQKPIENKIESNSTQSDPKKLDKPIQEDKPLPKPESLEKEAPKKQDGWTSLKNNYTRAHKVIETKDAEITKLKSALAEKGTVTTKEVETLKAENEDLRKFRAMVDIQADPEFVSTYDEPIKKSIASIKEMLMAMNINQKDIDNLKPHDFTDTQFMHKVVSQFEESGDSFKARKIQRKVEELLDLSDKRNETLIEHKDNHKKYIEDKKKETFTQTAENEGKIIQRLQFISKMKDKDEREMFPFLNKIEPKENSTQPEIDQMNTHNRLVDLMGQKLQQALSAKTPEDKADVAVSAVASHYLSSQLRVAVSKIASLQQELQKISAVGTETVSKKPAAPSRNGNGQELTIDDALSEHFTRR